MTDTSLQEEVVRGGVDVGAVESHPGAVRGAEAFSPVLSPTSPTSDTEHTTGTNTTNKRELFIAAFCTFLSGSNKEPKAIIGFIAIALLVVALV